MFLFGREEVGILDGGISVFERMWISIQLQKLWWRKCFFKHIYFIFDNHVWEKNISIIFRKKRKDLCLGSRILEHRHSPLSYAYY